MNKQKDRHELLKELVVDIEEHLLNLEQGTKSDTIAQEIVYDIVEDKLLVLIPTCDCCERPLEVDAQKQKIVDAVKEAKKRGRREVIKEIEEQAGETLFLLEDLKFWHDLKEEK
ncbi:hypothetical protein LCGC14_0384760 [marine sediment metagenome]|uniref:Uncharacterized protein n=1 Tax=marine sediment metagenome TaxID=412755 RepID=A0A0F9T702_9ZZZZ